MILKNINPVTEILQQSGIVPALHADGNKKKVLLELLEARGAGLSQVADVMANQLYSSDENIKDKAITRMLQLTEIVRKDEAMAAPSVTFVIQGIENQNIQSILIPREL